MGTRINQLQVVRVADGDTIRVVLNGKEQSLRLGCVDTEESNYNTDPLKPITKAGLAASQMAKTYFHNPDGSMPVVDLEFDTDDPIEVCLFKHRDRYGRLLCYVHKDGENYNLKLVREGWSPYFLKYGRSRFYHRQMMEAEAQAQAQGLVIWNPVTNMGGSTRPYDRLLPWWALRDAVIEEFRNRPAGPEIFSARLDYQKLLTAAENQATVTIFCDLLDGVKKWAGGGALVDAGSTNYRFNLWIPDREHQASLEIIQLIQTRYAHFGRGYVYITGKTHIHKEIPELLLSDVKQLSDFPPTN